MEEGCYSIAELMLLMTEEITETATSLDRGEAGNFIDAVLDAERIYVVGAGRSGLVARAFAMRLSHLDMEAFVVGETITPAMHARDLLVVFSGSGETNSMLEISESVQDLGGRICLITATPDSRIGKIADCVVNLGKHTSDIHSIPGRYEIRQLTGEYRSVSTSLAPFGVLFEITALIFSDAVVSSLMELRHCSLEEIKGRLPNIR